jgi:lipopolysaccharide transport system permease protein
LYLCATAHVEPVSEELLSGKLAPFMIVGSEMGPQARDEQASRLGARWKQGWEQRADLVGALVQRDIKVRYKGSWLGVVWGLATPLSQLLVFVFLFRGVVRLDIPHYPAYVFSALLAWNWFQSSLHGAVGSLVEGRGLVRRPGFPPAVLPAVSVATNFIHYLLALPVLVPFLLLDGLEVTPYVLFLPVVLALQFLFTLGLGYLIAVANVVARDSQQVLTLALMLLFYLTPIFYDADSVPLEFRWILLANPLALLMDAHRAVLLRGELPSAASLLALSLITFVTFQVGYTVFKRANQRLVEEL